MQVGTRRFWSSALRVPGCRVRRRPPPIRGSRPSMPRTPPGRPGASRADRRPSQARRRPRRSMRLCRFAGELLTRLHFRLLPAEHLGQAGTAEAHPDPERPLGLERAARARAGKPVSSFCVRRALKAGPLASHKGRIMEHLRRSQGLTGSIAEWGGWGSNPRPADYEKYGSMQHAR
jgi:hypothetical protein